MENNPKFRQILKKGKGLFWKHGFKRVTVEEICREAKVSKMTFYKFFKNKTELIKYILTDITDDSMRKFDQIMDQPVDFESKVRKMLELKREYAGEISQELFTELLQHGDQELRDFYMNIVNKNLKQIMNSFSQAKDQGEIRKEIKTEFIIYFLNHMFKMAEDPNLVSIYDSPKDLIMEITDFFFYGILSRQEPSKQN